MTQPINQSFRKIIHIDMDAFYPSVEQRDRPELRGKPVIVGGDPKSRGVVASASYEARVYGVRSAMSCAQAYRLCPHATFLVPNFDKYVAVSRRIREIFLEYTPLVEPLSLDEAYLDVTTNHLQEPLAKTIAKQIQERIRTELSLTASAGVGPNKFIAKLASDFKKPMGLVVIPPERVQEFIEHLAIEKFWGVGPATARKLRALGIANAAQLRSQSVTHLENQLGSLGPFLWNLAQGRDDRPVDPDMRPQSIGTEITFPEDIREPDRLFKTLHSQTQEISVELKKINQPARTVTLKIKYSNFVAITRSRTLFHPTQEATRLFETASELLFKNTEIPARAVRLIGLSVTQLIHPCDPLQLWFNFDSEL